MASYQFVEDLSTVYIGGKLAPTPAKSSKLPALSVTAAAEVEAGQAVNSVAATREAAKAGSTAANRLGQQMHKAYKANDVLDSVRIKEFTLPSGKRIDFIDLENKIIYELKPNNARAIKQGNLQLEMYK